jgi:hypothetical protein
MSRKTRTSPAPCRTPLFTAIALTLLSLALTLHAPAQDLARRLILNDGSFQLVTQYEVKGDRVRYKSAERDDWEELPTTLVDWPATEKYAKDRVTSSIPEAAALDREKDKEKDKEKDETEAELARLPQVAPGLRLPVDSGVFLLDNYQGQPQLVEMQQAEGDIRDNARASILRGALSPLAGAKQTVELEGEHATTHAHVAVPSLYINVDDALNNNEAPRGQSASAKPSAPSLDAPRGAQPQDPQKPQQPEQAIVPFDRFRIVHIKVKNGKRIVGNLKRNAAGKISQEQNFVKTTIDSVSGGWLKLTPTEDLAPGEYALIEMEGNEGMSLYVWDFSVDPNAPANANPWKPEVKPAEPEKKLSN